MHSPEAAIRQLGVSWGHAPISGALTQETEMALEGCCYAVAY